VSSPFISLKNQENIASASSDREASAFESSNCSYQSSLCGSPNTTTRTSLCTSCVSTTSQGSSNTHAAEADCVGNSAEQKQALRPAATICPAAPVTEDSFPAGAEGNNLQSALGRGYFK
jgi:hypothetical protein